MKKISKNIWLLCGVIAVLIIAGAVIASVNRNGNTSKEETHSVSLISTLMQTVAETFTDAPRATTESHTTTTTVISTTKPVTTKLATTVLAKTTAPSLTTAVVTTAEPVATVPETTQAETTGAKKTQGEPLVRKLVKAVFGIEKTTAEETTLPPLPSSAKVEGVPYLNQISLGYPMGCEAVSATMVLRFYGYDVTAEQMVNAVPTGSKKYQKDGVWYAADPFEEFVGDPRKKRADGAYGCFAKPLAEGMSKFAGDRVKNISGCTVEDLFRHVSEGRPVVVWGASNGVTIYEGVLWQCVDSNGNPTGKTYQELVREHCLVLIGYNEENVILHDPSKGANISQPMDVFTSNWTKLFSQAVIIK